MSVETVLTFFFKYNALLIEGLVALILLTTAYLALRLFKYSQDDELAPKGASAGPDMSKLEDMFKTILEKANQIPAATVHIPSEGGGGPSPEVASLVEQINSLKLELETKQAVMGAGGAGATAGEGGMSSEERAALEGKLNELQKKLEEYDIIAQDIADLSFFKEENQRLQQELANLKGGGAPATSTPPDIAKVEEVAAPAAVAAKTPEPEPAVEPPPAPAAAAVSAAPPVAAAEPATTPSTSGAISAAPSAAPAAEPISEDATSMLADWEAAVAEQSSPAPAGGSAPTSAPAGASAPTQEAEPAALDLGTMDLDKMTAEAGALIETPVEAVEDVLSQEMDPEKLAAEAAKMEIPGVPPETKTELTEFEKFINKGS